MKPFYWCVRGTVKLFVELFYGHKVYGTSHIQSGRAIIAPNHASFLDPPIISASWPIEISFLARKSLFSTFLIGWSIKRLNAYPVDGTNHDITSIKLICKLLNEDHQVVIFPSGVRSFDGKLDEIKSGVCMLALRCHAPIIPVYIYGSFDVWDRTRRFPKLRGKTACVIGSPVSWEPYAQMDKKEGQEAMRQKVAEAIEGLQEWYEKGAIGAPP